MRVFYTRLASLYHATKACLLGRACKVSNNVNSGEHRHQVGRREPCPVCLPGFDGSEPAVAVVLKRLDFETCPDCLGGGWEMGYAAGVLYGCRRCGGLGVAPVRVWVSEFGMFFHETRECMEAPGRPAGRKARKAERVDMAKARESGRLPCGRCYTAKAQTVAVVA